MDRQQRIEESEKLFREVNERVAQMHAGYQSDPDPAWVCECGDETCFEKIAVPVGEMPCMWHLMRPQQQPARR